MCVRGCVGVCVCARVYGVCVEGGALSGYVPGGGLPGFAWTLSNFVPVGPGVSPYSLSRVQVPL